MSKSLSKVTIHLNDLTTVDLPDFPDSADSMYAFVKEIRKEGCFVYNGDTCVYVFPTYVTKITFVRKDNTDDEYPYSFPEED